MPENTQSQGGHHLDVLKEIGTMGAGRAATALSEMISAEVTISVPDAQLIRSEDFSKTIARPNEAYLVLVIMLEGELGGRVFFMVSPSEARLLGSLLLGMPPEQVNFEDPLFQSSIKEALNIIVGAYMMALSELTGFEIMFSIPYLAMDILTAVFIADQTPQKSEELIYIKTELTVKGHNFGGSFVFFPDIPSIKKILNALGMEVPKALQEKLSKDEKPNG